MAGNTYSADVDRAVLISNLHGASLLAEAHAEQSSVDAIEKQSELHHARVPNSEQQSQQT